MAAARTSSAPGIYLHVPFCSAICPYCDFAVTTPGGGRRARYIPALSGEIAAAASDPWRGAVPPPAADTIYFGGGTPSLLEPGELAAILQALRSSLPLVADPPGDDLSVLDFCAVCKKCAENCPSRSIPFGEPERIDGGYRWAIDSDAGGFCRP